MKCLTSRICAAARCTVIITAAAAAGIATTAAARAASREAPPTTPAGITLVEVVRELPISQPEILWIRLGDRDGRTVLIHDEDPAQMSSCAAECAAEFPPLVAPRGAKAFGDWSIVRRADGSHQWAYQSHPLYTWQKEQVPGEVATNVGLTETANSKLAENPVVAGSLMPPPNWRVARFEPEATLTVPDGMGVRLVSAAQAVVLTDGQGHTLYFSEGDARRTGGRDTGHDAAACATEGCASPASSWRPVAAAALAAGTGEFSIVTRADGSRQWAYKDRPLYSYRQDRLPGDVRGTEAGEHWSVAVLTRNFRPENVDVVRLEGYGDVLTLKGMTLYGGYAFEKRWGGRNLRDTFTNVYYKGKRLGADACANAQCLSTWRPLRAPANAQPNGFWEPIRRQDGTLQWAYKGYALYTHAGDEAPGQHNGQATYDFARVEGAGFDFQRVSYLQDISRASGGVGIYWNIAKP